MLDIAGDRRKTSKRERQRQREREREREREGGKKQKIQKVQTTTINVFSFYGRMYMLFQNIVQKSLIYTITFVLQCFCAEGSLKMQ